VTTLDEAGIYGHTVTSNASSDNSPSLREDPDALPQRGTPLAPSGTGENSTQEET